MIKVIRAQLALVRLVTQELLVIRAALVIPVLVRPDLQVTKVLPELLASLASLA